MGESQGSREGQDTALPDPSGDGAVAVQPLPVLPLRNLVVFPGLMLPVDVGRPRSLRLVEDAVQRGGGRLAIATQRNPQAEDPGPEELYPVGVLAEMLKVVKLAENRLTVVLRGIHRIRLGELVQRAPYLVLQVEELRDQLPDPANTVETAEVEGLTLAVRKAAKQVIALSPEIPDEEQQVIDQIRESSRLADVAAANLDLATEERIRLLEQVDVKERLKTVLAHLQHRIEVFKVKERIDTQVREEFSKTQREAVLRQKLKAIQEELGEFEEGEDLSEFEEKIKAAGMPADVEKTARKQLDRLRVMPAASAEYTVTRTYLEWLVELPWSKLTQDDLDIAHARHVLDADHYDLEKVKKRILEYLAVRKLNPGKRGPILCLSGPPGVGKTSLGKSIARALGREFVRISLGGVRDEAEIRGHRRTYIGALPGRIVQGIKRAGTSNPVFMLDEIDKLGADFRGDPSSALLEVLDPEQNFSFSDHYLEVPFDLSRVLFIGTANYLDPIPPALRDRLEIIELPGYTREEKLFIAKQYLLPKQLSEHGLVAAHVTVLDSAILEIIEHYTREAGVRNLERELANVCRAIAVKVAAGETYKAELGASDLAALLGPPRFFAEVAMRTEEPGVATALAWTPTGGDLLFIEATRMPGRGNLVLTGQLGNVMKESAQAALSFVRARTHDFGIPANFFDKIDLHVHVPAGAIPKDGPSAGVALLAAIASLFTQRRVRGDTAMTGEITLRGTVLPVGGIKEKVLAAHRAGIQRVILPERNRKDIVDVPDEARRELALLFVRNVDEALREALEALPTGAQPEAPGAGPPEITPAAAPPS